MAANGLEAVERSCALRPDVVLMDLEMPTMDGVEATRRLTVQLPACAVLVLTSYSDMARIRGALHAGARGYLLKDASAEELAEGIRAAADGQSPLDPRAAKELLAVLGSPSIRFSGRQREVLSLLVADLPNRLIARRLQLSEKTVKTHLTRIFREIYVADRTQAALWAERNGYR